MLKKAVIIDDEAACIRTLEIYLKKYFPDWTLAGTALNGNDGLRLINEQEPQLAFVDIQMPLMNGLDMVNRMPAGHTRVVFTTAFDQYAIRAIKLSAFDYLLKPIEPEELKACIERWENEEQQSDNSRQKDMLKHVLEGHTIPYIALSTLKGLLFIKPEDIMYCEAESNYTNVHMQDGSMHLVSKSLVHFEDVLDSNRFFRIHKSYIINLHCITQYIRGEGGEVVLQNGICIPLSRNRKDEFLGLFGKV